MDRRPEPTRAVPVVSPANMLPVQVIRRQVIAPDVVAVQIVLPGARQAPAPYLPGQFVTLALPTPHETLYRSYSLCGDGDVARPWELAIKRMESGAVSTYFYDSVQAGTLLYSSLPRGTFTLPVHVGPDTPLVMVALGSGITPIMGMLRAINRMPTYVQPLVHLHYASRSPEEEIFGEELERMDPDQLWLRQWPYYSSADDRLTPEIVLWRSGALATRADWYMCGPESLKRELQDELDQMGVERRYIHSEVFATKSGPAYIVEESDGTGVGGRITIGETGATVDALPQETLLTALERAGYHPAFSCRAGACGACKLKVLAGQVDPVGEALSDADRAAGYVLSCIARPIGDITLAPVGLGVGSGVGGVAAGAPQSGTRALVRLGAFVGVSALLLTSWNLTDHRPVSWAQASASSVAPGATPGVASGTTPGTTSGATPGATAQPGAAAAPTATAAPQGGAQPTATSASGAQPTAPPAAQPTSSSGAPQPTATPKPQPTAAPKPTPTCVATPSKPC